MEGEFWLASAVVVQSGEGGAGLRAASSEARFSWLAVTVLLPYDM